MGWNNEISFRAGGTIAPCRFLAADSSADEQVVQATVEGQPALGISQEGMKTAPGLTGSDNTVAAVAGDQLRVFGQGCDCLLELGGTVSAGDEIMTTTAGKGELATSGYYVNAIALQAGTNGKKIRVMIVRYQKSVSGSSNQ